MDDGKRCCGGRRFIFLISLVAVAFLMVSVQIRLSSRVSHSQHLSSDALQIELSIILPFEKISQMSSNASAMGESLLRGIHGFSQGLIAEGSTNDEGRLPNNLTDYCLRDNTAQWLNEKRIGNAEGGNLAASMRLFEQGATSAVGSLPLFQGSLEESFCLPGSPFLAGWNDVTSADDEQSLHIGATRLIYLALVYHQHAPAWPEYRERRKLRETGWCDSVWKGYGLNNSTDYECAPDTKYIVMPLTGAGLGALLRIHVFSAVKAALGTGRVLLFHNNVRNSTQNKLTPGWEHVSCARMDYQCFFRPTTPCSLTDKDLATAHVLSPSEAHQMMKHSRHPEDQRVVVFKPNRMNYPDPPMMRQELHRIAHKMIEDGLVPNTPKVQQSAALIKEPTGGADLMGATLFYFLRPRPDSSEQLQHIQSDLFPADWDSRPSIGMPIRASDKCQSESECLSFESYVRAADEWWTERRPNATNSSIQFFVTTESSTILEQQEKVLQEPPFWQQPFQFFRNTHDIAQDSGEIRRVRNTHDAGQVLLGSLSSIQAQLRHSIVFGNCCSNFHRLMKVMLRHGCGTRREVEFVCLQDHSNQTYQMCCQWTSSERCEASRAERREARKAMQEEAKAVPVAKQ